jgi:glycosyltransferase involved in cell wall biosynthesis
LKKNYIVINVIDSEKGGGAERLVDDFLNNSAGRNVIRVTLAPNRRYLYFSFILRSVGLISFIIKKSINNNIFIHLHLSKAIYLSPILSLLPVNIFITEHNTWNKRRKYPFLKVYERFAYSRATKIIAVSAAVRLSLVKWLDRPNIESKIIVIHNGVPLKGPQLTYRPIVSSKSLNILVVASLTPQKNVSLIIEALANWKYKNWFCTIAGNGPQYKSLQDMILSRQLADKIFLAGYLNNIAVAYCSSDVLVVTSEWEGFGLVAVEAMSHGLPVVWPDVQGIDEVLSSAPISFKFAAGNCGSLIRRLDEARNWVFVNDFRMQLNAFAREKFSLDNMISNYWRVYGLENE